MSVSSSEDKESHHRLIGKEYSPLDQEENWKEDVKHPLRRKKYKYENIIKYSSLACNVALSLLCLGLWSRSRSPLPPWPNTLYCRSPYHQCPHSCWQGLHSSGTKCSRVWDSDLQLWFPRRPVSLDENRYDGARLIKITVREGRPTTAHLPKRKRRGLNLWTRI